MQVEMTNISITIMVIVTAGHVPLTFETLQLLLLSAILGLTRVSSASAYPQGAFAFSASAPHCKSVKSSD
eukprot:4073623-Amphidinium_carterae.1